MTVRMISPAGHPGDIHPDEVAHMQSHGWRCVDDAEPSAPVSECSLTDAELRAAIEAATGTAPHHRTGRAKLLAQYEAIR